MVKEVIVKLDKMLKRLFEASWSENYEELIKLVTGDENILIRSLDTWSKTPLHVAATMGHAKFGYELLQLNPNLTRDKNYHLSTPLHLASAKGHLEMVSIVNGKDDVFKLFINTQQLSIVSDKRGETVLYLSVNYSRFETMKLILESNIAEELVNLKNIVVNTALHLAVEIRGLEGINLLLIIKE
ncbi:ankyrin repeat-containing protein ITN1-like, partial [Telopea speciosissima]|uniref:ankyrin repeat-containing protein ITN1-like n=1 Tax=Telopea speciosissima TaxID=54955 RepID=UPI001CC384ED